jgi:hypothetical protein
MPYQSVLPTIQQRYRIEGSLSLIDNVLGDLHHISVINVTEMDPDMLPDKNQWTAEKRLWDFLRECAWLEL